MTARFPRPLVGVVTLLLAFTACHSGSPSASPAPAASSGSPTPTSPTPTFSAGHRVITALAVWVTKTTSSQKIRVTRVAGGPVRVVLTIPGDASVWAVGSGKLAAFWSHAIHVVDLTRGRSVTYSPGSGDTFFGGAFSPDGTHLAYVSGTPSGGALRSLDLTAHTFRTLRTFPNNSWDVPNSWHGSVMAGNVIIGYSDAGSAGAFRLNASTGARLGFTNDSGSSGATFAADATHAADSVHASLGDDADAPPGPGPSRPFNTLRAFAVGGAPAVSRSEAHHDIFVPALSSEGSTIYYYDDSSAGGFAGISSSPDFGLFSITRGARHQIARYDGGRWDGGAYVSGSTFVASERVGTGERLVRVAGISVTTLATSPGTEFGFVGVTTITVIYG